MTGHGQGIGGGGNQGVVGTNDMDAQVVERRHAVVTAVVRDQRAVTASHRRSGGTVVTGPVAEHVTMTGIGDPHGDRRA
jgi:hypothetical protein